MSPDSSPTDAAEQPIAILVAPAGASGALWSLLDRLGPAVAATVVDALGEAAAIAARAPSPPCVLLDLRALGHAQPEDLQAAADAVAKARAALPGCAPIAVIERRGEDPSTPLVLACFRAGAADVIDLTLEGTAPARAVVARVWQEQRARAADRQTAATLRGLVEDFFRSLIRTERRSLDLEGRLARSGGIAADATDEERPPGVLLVEGDRALAGELTDVLTRAGLATFAYVSAEDVLYAVDNLLARGAGFDLALIAAQLPGMDGIELLRDLRHRIPDLPAFIMTAPGERVARDAAGLGVVGYAEKPLADLAELVGHVGRLARQAHLRTREHMYLKAIKDRHERVLAQYRALPPET